MMKGKKQKSLRHCDNEDMTTKCDVVYGQDPNAQQGNWNTVNTGKSVSWRLAGSTEFQGYKVKVLPLQKKQMNK